MENKYKSPLKKLLKVFETGRDQWKEKTINAKRQIKIQKSRIKFLEDSKAKLKQENIALKAMKQQIEQKLIALEEAIETEEHKKKFW